MNKFLISIAMLFSMPVMACDADCVREYFTENGHEYLRVTGYCRGKVQYTVHLQQCPCGDGLYELKNGS